MPPPSRREARSACRGTSIPQQPGSSERCTARTAAGEIIAPEGSRGSCPMADAGTGRARSSRTWRGPAQGKRMALRLEARPEPARHLGRPGSENRAAWALHCPGSQSRTSSSHTPRSRRTPRRGRRPPRSSRERRHACAARTPQTPTRREHGTTSRWSARTARSHRHRPARDSRRRRTQMSHPDRIGLPPHRFWLATIRRT